MAISYTSTQKLVDAAPTSTTSRAQALVFPYVVDHVVRATAPTQEQATRSLISFFASAATGFLGRTSSNQAWLHDAAHHEAQTVQEQLAFIARRTMPKNQFRITLYDDGTPDVHIHIAFKTMAARQTFFDAYTLSLAMSQNLGPANDPFFQQRAIRGQRAPSLLHTDRLPDGTRRTPPPYQPPKAVFLTAAQSATLSAKVQNAPYVRPMAKVTHLF